MQDRRAQALYATSALVGIALASATVQAADYTVPSDLLSDVQGYIDTAGNDDLKSRWEAAYATLTGNVEWVPAQEVTVKSEYGDYTKVVEGYWGVKGKDGMRAITLASASLYADLHKAKRWRPVKQAIRKLLRNDMYGVAMVVEAPKPFYEQWGGWANVSSFHKTRVGELGTPAQNMEWAGIDNLLGGTYEKHGALPPVEVGGQTSYKFTANLTNTESLHSGYRQIDDAKLELDYAHTGIEGAKPWNAKLSYRMGNPVTRGDPRLQFTHNWTDLQWTSKGAMAQIADGVDDNSLLTGQFYRRTTSTGMVTIGGEQHTQYPYRVVGGVITPNMAGTYITDSVDIPAPPTSN